MLVRMFIDYRCKKLRRQDLDSLWPCCRDYATDLAVARESFFSYVCEDPAWRHAYSVDELIQFVDRLT